MQHSQVLAKMEEEIVEDQQKILIPILLIKDHRLKVLIHPLLESRDQEITVQDLMINQRLLSINYSSPFQK